MEIHFHEFSTHPETPFTIAAMNEPSLVIGGRVIRGEELREYAQRNGLCPICGTSQTHEKKGTFLRPRLEPITRKNTSGAFTVYKGYCMAPTCYTLNSAKKLLGEVPTRNSVDGYQISETAVEVLNPQLTSPGGHTRGFQPPPAFVARHSATELEHNRIIVEEEGRAVTSTRFSAPFRLGRLSEHLPLQDSFTETSLECSQRSQQPFGHPMPNPMESSEQSYFSMSKVGNVSDPARLSIPSQAAKSTRTSSSSSSSSASPLIVGSNIPSLRTKDKGEATHQLEDPLILALQEKVQERNYLEFINLLDSQDREPRFLLESFRLLRKCVVAEHLLEPDCFVFPGDNWLKAIQDRIHHHDRDVVISCLVTLTTISRQSGAYRRSMIRKDVIEKIIGIVDQWSDDEEVMVAVCSVIIALSLQEKGYLNAKSYPKIGNLIQKLAAIVLSDENYGKGAALRALFQLSCQRAKNQENDKDALHYVQNSLGAEPCIQAIIDIIGHEQEPTCVVEAGLFLLWKICIPLDNDASTILGATDHNIANLCGMLEKAFTAEIVEPCLGLLATLAVSPNFTSTMAHQVISRISELLDIPGLKTIDIVDVASHALCNLVGRTSHSPGRSNPKMIIDMSGSILVEFSSHEEIAHCCCLALSQVSWSVELKEYLATSSVFSAVRSIFEAHVVHQPRSPSLLVQDACFRFFASVSGCHSGSMILIESGLSDQLKRKRATESEGYTLDLLDAILANVGKFCEGVVLREPGLFVQLLRTAITEHDSIEVISQLYESCEVGNTRLDDDELEELLSVMRRFGYSTQVLQAACQLLAWTFSQVLVEKFDSTNPKEVGLWARQQHKQAVEVLCCSMDGKRESVDVQIGCMNALSNLFLPLCTLSRSSRTILEVQSWITPVAIQVLKALESNEGDGNLQESGFHLSWILVAVSSDAQRSYWAMGLLLQVFASLTKVTSAERVNILGCEIILQLQENQDCCEFIVNSSYMESILHLLGGQSMELCLLAATLLSKLAVEAMDATYQLLQFPNIPEHVIGCLKSCASNASIPCHVIILLEALMKVCEVGFLQDVVANGGLQALAYPIEVQPTNTALCEHAARAMSILVSSADDVAIESFRDVIHRLYLPLLHTHVDSPTCQAALLDLICSFANRDDAVKSMLLDMRHLEIVVKTLEAHLESDDLQRSGCRLLRLLIGFGDGKRRVGAVGGVVTILNAMLAHCNSASIQQDALVALKSLATDNGNKSILATHECVRAVTLSLWINFRRPEVILSALSALNNMAVDSQAKSVAPVPSEILDIVASTMQRFPKDERIQKSACFYLKNCTYLPENVLLMKQSAGVLVGVLLQASQCFPKSCQVLAYSVIMKIEG